MQRALTWLNLYGCEVVQHKPQTDSWSGLRGLNMIILKKRHLLIKIVLLHLMILPKIFEHIPDSIQLCEKIIFCKKISKSFDFSLVFAVFDLRAFFICDSNLIKYIKLKTSQRFHSVLILKSKLQS